MISEMKKILSIRNLVDKKAYFMSLLTRETELKNVKPIVVGGSAVDFYTNGVFQSNDIDLVGSRKIIGETLENTFGFKRSGRHWIDEQIGIFIEVPGDYLAGSRDKITTMTVEGLKLYIIGIEDLIIDRMAACQEWKSETDCRQAHYLLRYYKSRIDFEGLHTHGYQHTGDSSGDHIQQCRYAYHKTQHGCSLPNQGDDCHKNPYSQTIRKTNRNLPRQRSQGVAGFNFPQG